MQVTNQSVPRHNTGNRDGKVLHKGLEWLNADRERNKGNADPAKPK